MTIPPSHVVYTVDGAILPVNKILAVGRNYADHAAEMDAPAVPVIFMKPATALRNPGEPVRLPRGRGSVHHEVEVVVWLERGGSALDAAAAAAGIGAYGLGLDLTLRDVQTRAKAEGKPWTLAKGFDGSLPVSPFVRAAAVADPAALAFSLDVDGVRRQTGRAAGMLLPVGKLLSAIAAWITLEPGDLILTGTPSGVGPVAPGERAVLTLDGHFEHAVEFV
jgi:2-keto-4-pentenoate hydratase/2-oxohepta-3-ene-1,7-dioic acid hydratase in catechol pathway